MNQIGIPEMGDSPYVLAEYPIIGYILLMVFADYKLGPRRGLSLGQT